jgi:PadR family transcriptional regulator PadR
MGREGLQAFELQVLLVALRLGEAAYSVPIVLELERQTGRRVSQAAVFIALRRLEKRGLLVSQLDEASASHGRARRYVRLTPSAKQLLRETRDVQTRLWRGLNRVLGGR